MLSLTKDFWFGGGGGGEEEEENTTKQNKGCVTLYTLPFTLKSILRQKKNFLETQIFFTMQKYNLQKIL
jgi:hypothetical protein